MRKTTTEDFISKSRDIYGDKYDYSKVVYKNMRTRIIITCRTHGDFIQLPNGHIHGREGCVKCKSERLSLAQRKSTKDFIHDSEAVHGKTYDYSKTDYINSKQNVIIICREHGEFRQLPNNHLKGAGCRLCANEIFIKKRSDTTVDFIKKARDIHGERYDYDNVKYISSHKKVSINCKKHGAFRQKPYSHLNGSGCSRCRSSRGESRIRVFLEHHNINFIEEKTFEDCINVTLLRFDFYLPDNNLLIEFHGKQHYKFVKKFHRSKKGFISSQKRDKIKEVWAFENDIWLLIIPYTEINNLDEILSIYI